MSLPKVEIPEILEKPIEQIKNPILKILIICLLFAVILLGSALIYQSQNKDKNYKQENESLKADNKELRQTIADMKDAEIKRLQIRDHYFDSLILNVKSTTKQIKEQ